MSESIKLIMWSMFLSGMSIGFAIGRIICMLKHE